MTRPMTNICTCVSLLLCRVTFMFFIAFQHPHFFASKAQLIVNPNNVGYYCGSNQRCHLLANPHRRQSCSSPILCSRLIRKISGAQPTPPPILAQARCSSPILCSRLIRKISGAFRYSNGNPSNRHHAKSAKSDFQPAIALKEFDAQIQVMDITNEIKVVRC